MPTSTEDALRDALVALLQGIATTQLGFDLPNGNVHDYLFEHERDELTPGYLSAKVGGKPKVRAWGVWVTGADEFYAAGGMTRRLYQVRLEGYYKLEANGAAHKLLVTHGRAIRHAVVSTLGTTLGNRVDTT